MSSAVQSKTKIDEDSWYELIIDSSPFQGDIIENFKYVAKSIIKTGESLILTSDIIVLSQSCDMVGKRPKLKNILIAPLFLHVLKPKFIMTQ